MTDTLMVGVSGIRGIVDKDLTPDIVRRYATAFGRWASERRPLVVVGRDSRQSGPAFAQATAAGLAAAGCDVIDVGVVPTPTIQLAVTHHGAGGGIAITASHNPIQWNALKFIAADGIFLDGPDGARVLALVEKGGRGKGEAGRVKKDAGSGKGKGRSRRGRPSS
jgi:phosphomannomutase